MVVFLHLVKDCSVGINRDLRYAMFFRTLFIHAAVESRESAHTR